MQCSVVIPTYKRPESLLACVRSLVEQTRVPDVLLIIDDDTLPSDVLVDIRSLCERVQMQVVYHQKDHQHEPQGSATSRNIGVEKSQHDIVFIFDDDIVLEPAFVASVMNEWEVNSRDEQLFAVGGIISNNRVPSRFEKFYHRIGGLGDMNTWDINAVGFQSWNDGITETQVGHYAHGGVCSYQKSHLASLGGFATFQGGRTALEDVEMFFKAKLAGLYTIVVPVARAWHDHHPSGREASFATGYKEGFNRVQIYKRYAPSGIKYLLWFTWASSAWTDRKFLTGKFAYWLGMQWGTVRSMLTRATTE